ncbi:Prolipoprotein diacylglyceryl transferase [Alteripontixanthobacter maritimus]|uniref:Phosphatidylglycerol--prolipoprotein diacylglyceryl transferase n=1 Tax=Alteripontixanthobacter maritimus TaxID=2161824 RepID=A0A369Q9Q0_9SPHN|nr:prolipoprotein diacylglyceryl transferase [Alteripontixanthobacter maritimus]RDC59018.1 Prolipoprotein diacylglyceryl transferase [Alteripontixanthobacter maritimus]
MLSLLASAGDAPIQWAELGLKPGIDLGFFTLRYYSLAYLGGIVLGYWHLTRMIKAPGAPMAARHAEDLFFYCTLGIILGGRLGYAMFYDPSLFTSFDGDGFVSWGLLRLWDGGMSFHGGLMGVLVAIAWVSRSGGLSFLRVCDYIAVNVPFGMFFGRMANFINGELWGRPTDVPWAMVFPTDPLQVGRHPSQLYEAALEGAILIVILLLLFWKTRARYRPGLLVGVFTAGIALGRFTVEFFRQPDAQLTEFARDTGLSMGQWLTIPLILLGIFVTVRALMKPPIGKTTVPPPEPEPA